MLNSITTLPDLVAAKNPRDTVVNTPASRYVWAKPDADTSFTGTSAIGFLWIGP